MERLGERKRLRAGSTWNAYKEIKKRSEEKGFQVIKHRWIVERTFGWLGRYRLLSKDSAATIASSEAEIHLAMTHLMLNRLTHQVPENEYKFASVA